MIADFGFQAAKPGAKPDWISRVSRVSQNSAKLLMLLFFITKQWWVSRVSRHLDFAAKLDLQPVDFIDDIFGFRSFAVLPPKGGFSGAKPATKPPWATIDETGKDEHKMTLQITLPRHPLPVRVRGACDPKRRLPPSGQTRDRYNRAVRQCFVNGQDIAAEMVKQGRGLFPLQWRVLFGRQALTAWYAIQVRPGAERRVGEALTERGGLVYIPLERRWRWLGTQRKYPIERPLIRGYVFASVADALLAVVLEVEGALRLIGYDPQTERATPIPDRFVDEMREAEARGAFDRTAPQKRRRFRKDERVRLTKGEFAGRIGKIAKLAGAERVKVVLEVVGWQVTADTADVEAVDPEPTPKAA